MGNIDGFPENYEIFVELASPIIHPFQFANEAIPAGFRVNYKTTGLNQNTTYYVDVKWDR